MNMRNSRVADQDSSRPVGRCDVLGGNHAICNCTPLCPVWAAHEGCSRWRQTWCLDQISLHLEASNLTKDTALK